MKNYYDICMEKLKENEKWLDIGCGSANFLKNAISDKNIELHGMDVVDESISRAVKNGINCIKNSASEKYPYEDQTFDMVTSTDVLEHLRLDDVKNALSEIYRVLKKGKYSLLAPATTPDATGHLHLTVKSKQWWVSELENVGFTFIGFHAPKGILLRK